MKLLHLADVHFDTPLACKSEVVRLALRDGVRRAFAAAVTDAIATGVAVVLIAGDLFDDDTLTLETERFVVAELARLVQSGIPVIYATGNHDPAGVENPGATICWPEGVAVVDGQEPAVIELGVGPEALRVVAAGHDSPRVTTNLAATFPTFDDGIPTVGLLHANIEGGDSSPHGRYAPCSVRDLDSKRYDYWALGHVHAPATHGSSGNIRYSGCIQGRHFREAGPRGGSLVTLEPGNPVRVEHREYACVRWETIDISLEDPSGRLKEIEDEIRARVVALKSGVTGALALRISISGASNRWKEFRDPDQIDELASAWSQELEVLHVELDASGVLRPVDVDALATETTVLAEALRVVDEIAGDTTIRRALLSRILPEAATAGGVGYIDELASDADWLRSELAARFTNSR